MEPRNDTATSPRLSSSHGSPSWLYSLPVKMFVSTKQVAKQAALGFYSCSFIANPVRCSSKHHNFLPLPGRVLTLLMYSHGHPPHQVHVTLGNLNESPFGGVERDKDFAGLSQSQ